MSGETETRVLPESSDALYEKKKRKKPRKEKDEGVEGDLRTNFLSRGPSRDAVLSGCIVSVDLCVGAAGLFSFMAHGFF